MSPRFRILKLFRRVSVDLPAIVGKRLIRFSHLVHVFTLLDGSAAASSRFEKLSGQALSHRMLRASASCIDDPAGRQGLATSWFHFDRNLVSSSTHAAGLHFQHRLNVLKTLLEEGDA